MKDKNAGYDGGKKQFSEMCAEGGKVMVKGYARGGAVKKVAAKSVPKAFPKAPPIPTPTSKDTPKLVKVAATKPAPTKKFAKGGAVHEDAKQDKKIIKAMVDKSCIKKGKK